ncbi:hypothetical protein K2Z83_08730 [Oscillochloris sp. ZM17-4]|uniref:hypothetical protein n=1 Tax=Oscillochloris sp. ZM17-4 TaxID=2866714 RepID=UPI001C736AE5|nr:hypothetical protein [Oscillochloris sp. ZM17-4]MBX0327760.1 hypothetical protein [Oscillochloris sp. ZM17-4]
MALMAFALAASSLAFGGTIAQAQTTATGINGKWGSAILIQNVGSGPLNSGDYSIAFYDSNGGTTPLVTYKPDKQIIAGSSAEFYIPNITTAPTLASGQYSAVISSSQAVKAVVNSSTDSATTGPWSAFSYEGVDAAEAKSPLYFPAFYRNYYTFLSELVIQNAGTTTANVKATLYNGLSGASSGEINLGQIPANASRTYGWNDTKFSSLASGNTGIYGVVVTADQPLAGISNIWSSDSTNYGVGSYNAFTAGANTVYAGSMYNQYYGFVSSLTVQNIDTTTAASVTISYSDGTTDGPFSIPAGQSRERYQPNNASLSSGNTNGLLSATITSTGAQVVAIVNIQRKSRTNIAVADPSNPAFGSYSAAITTPSTSVSVPAIFNDYYGYFTAVSVKNTGAATSIKLTYADGTTWTQNAAAGATVNFSHLPTNPNNPLKTSIQTSGTVSSTQPLVVVIQHNTDPSLSSYRPAKSPNDFLFVLSGFPK